MDKKHWIKFDLSSLYSHCHFYFIGILLLLIGFEYPIIWIGYFFYTIFYFYRTKKINRIYLVLSFLFCIGFMYHTKTISLPNKIEHMTWTVLEREQQPKQIRYLVKYKQTRAYLYLKDGFYVPGDQLRISGSVTKPRGSTHSGTFDVQFYLKQKRIVYFIQGYTAEKIGHTFVFSAMQFQILQLVDHYPKPLSQYIKTLFFGKNEIDTEIKEGYQGIGMSHLFAISGLHISLLIIVLDKFLKKVLFDERKQQFYTFLFLVVYMVLTNFIISATRAILMYSFLMFNKRHHHAFTRLDALSISGLLYLFGDPTALFTLSFQLSYVVTFFLILVPIKEKDFLKRSYLVTILCQAAILPWILRMNYEVNVLGIMLGPFYILIFIYGILWIVFAGMSLPWLSNWINQLLALFEYGVSILNEWTIFKLRFGFWNLWQCALYYLFFLCLFIIFPLRKENLKWKVMSILNGLCLLLISLLNINKMCPYDRVTFLDVEQGDTSIIELAHGKGVIIIDAYGSIADVLASKGYRTIDYLFLTHNHDDHVREAQRLLTEFHVRKLVISPFEPDLLTLKQKGRVLTVQKGAKLSLHHLQIQVLHPNKQEQNLNNQSLVLKINLQKHILLFTGDIEKEAERELREEQIRADILKVPHHGRQTSSTIDFLTMVQPKYAIFSYGVKNQYGLPDAIVRKRYQGVICFETAIHGSIKFTFYENSIKIRTFPP